MCEEVIGHLVGVSSLYVCMCVCMLYVFLFVCYNVCRGHRTPCASQFSGCMYVCYVCMYLCVFVME